MQTLPTTPPRTRLEPTQVAPETFLLHDHTGEGTAPIVVSVNTMVIRAAEPVVVDTGFVEHGERYLDDVFSLVEPEDVRWVFVSHDDVDHTGSLNALMDACPNATLVINWFIHERMGASLAVPPTRWRWVGDGESFDVGDRTLQAVRPPVFDSPTTRGLFDPETGVYWASDAFATPLPSPMRDTADLDRAAWLDGMHMFGQYVSPWLTMVDDGAYQRTVDRIEALAPSVIAGCHTPAITGHEPIRAALENARQHPTAVVPPQPDQSVLEEIQRSMTALSS